MKNRLKYLYKYLIENRKHEIQEWHNAYEKFYDEVREIKTRIQDGTRLSQSDEPFLKQLLYEKNNGIASRGQSVLSSKDFDSFIRDKNFITVLERFILNPLKNEYKNLGNTWVSLKGSNNPVLVNRIAAACTLKVSTTVDSKKFNQVFRWLTKEKIIPEYPSDAEQDWYSKNVFLLLKLKEEFQPELDDSQTDEFYLSQFVWVLYENLFNPFSLKKQIVKYGSPGTGKTFQAHQQTSLLFEIWKEEFAPNSDYCCESQIELIQFHPSFSYEDFIEGLRPELDKNGSTQLTLQNGIFKEFCMKSGIWEIDVHELPIKEKWSLLKIKDLLPYKDTLEGDHWNHIFEVQDSSKLVSDAVPPFFFIIDEINRAELSRVFGELMYCLEYRGVEGKIKTQYANLNNDDTGMLCVDRAYTFFIPSNVYLIGTMNTIDRSIESFDFALRRRFRWEEVSPDIDLLRYHLSDFNKDWMPLAENLDSLNKLIEKEPLLGIDYKIGHSYFMHLRYSLDLTATEVRVRIWDDSIRPLLQEYLRGTGKENELISVFKKAFGVI